MPVKEKLYWDLSSKINEAAIEVHKTLGSGYIESIYHNAMKYELELQNIPFETEKEIQIFYKEEPVGLHRLDLLIDNKIIVELKAVSEVTDIHRAQVLSYLKAAKLNVGLIINFSKNRIYTRRVVYDGF